VGFTKREDSAIRTEGGDMREFVFCGGGKGG